MWVVIDSCGVMRDKKKTPCWEPIPAPGLEPGCTAFTAQAVLKDSYMSRA